MMVIESINATHTSKLCLIWSAGVGGSSVWLPMTITGVLALERIAAAVLTTNQKITI